MSTVKQFNIGGINYNVVRASAVQQDEVLSMLSTAVINRLAIVAVDYPKPIEELAKDEEVMFNFFTSLPFEVKQTFDNLMLSNFKRHGEEVSLSARDFDGKLLELNQLRASVLLWNLEPFFVYWANVAKRGKEQAQAVLKTQTAV